jgi:hypothetical protein
MTLGSIVDKLYASSKEKLAKTGIVGKQGEAPKTQEDPDTAERPATTRYGLKPLHFSGLRNGRKSSSSRSRSKSPDRKPNSRNHRDYRAEERGEALRIAEERRPSAALVKALRSFPSFRSLIQSGNAQVVFTQQELSALEASMVEVGESIEAQISGQHATPWDILKDPRIIGPVSLRGKTLDNSNYTNTHIAELTLWEDFPTFREIKAFIDDNLELSKIFHTYVVHGGAQKPWYEEIYNDPCYILANEENSLARNLHPFFQQLSTLIRLATHGPPEEDEVDEPERQYKGMAPGHHWLIIDGGKSAMQRRVGGRPKEKIPDLVAHWTDGNHEKWTVRKCEPILAEHTPCLIVGDFKMFEKFNHSMLTKTATTPKTTSRLVSKALRRPLDQIHDYMDMHHDRYGYIINHNELIMFRRKDLPPNTWGHLEFSPEPIPLSTDEPGKLNAMMVLWYFHVKYAVMELGGGWRLESTWDYCPRSKLGDSAKDLNDAELASRSYS